MALSDWDVAALNEKSEPTSGVFKTLDGKYTFEIYKDNLSVYLGNEFLFTIYDGSFQIGGVDIVASRPKDKRGIYVVISEIRYRDIQNVPYRDKNNKPTSKERILVGCGVDGWTHSETEFTEGHYVMQKVFESGKIESIFTTTYDSAQDVKEDVDLYNKNLDKLDPDPKGKFVFKAEPLGDYVWQGVTKQDIDALQKLYEDNFHYNNAKIDFTKALRYNAGDAYFAGKIGDFELPATAVGEADTPILSQALGMGGGKKDHAETLYDEVNNNKDPDTAHLPVLLGYRFGDTEKGNSVWRSPGHKAKIGWEPGVEEMVEWIYAQTKAAVYISFMPMIPNGIEIHVPYYDNLPDDQRPDFRADTLYAACEKAVRQVYKDFVATEG